MKHPTESVQLVADSTRTMELLLAAVASVSLLVGSIGIMNIMLVSVTARTREIGIRLAVGGTGSEIPWQFLTEAVLLTLCGGGAGVLVEYAGSTTPGSYLGWPMIVSPQAVGIALGVSSAIGSFFGFYPAYRAATLCPIRALQSE